LPSQVRRQSLCVSVRWALNLEIAKNRTKQAVGPLGRVGSNPTPGAYITTKGSRSTTGYAFSSILTLSTSPCVSPGSYSMTVTGSGGGKTHTATIRLIVSQAKDFRIDISPPTQTISQGQVTSYSLSIVGLNGFNSPVSLSLAGLPAGANYAFSIPSGTPDFSSVLTVTLPNNVQTGSFTLTVTGSGGGLNRVASAVLVITAA